jgi:lysophospholipase L1-like esterase
MARVERKRGREARGRADPSSKIPKPDPPGLVRKGAGLLVGLAISISILGVTGEIVARAVGAMDRMNIHPRRLYARSDDPRLQYQLRPGEEGLRVHGQEVRVNRRGLRGAEITAAPAEGVRRIFVLGDSVVFGWGLAEEETFSSQLEAELRGRGLAVEVLNGGTPGYNTLSELAHLESVGLPLAPDLVILGVSLNDFSATPRLNPQGFMTTRQEEDEDLHWLERSSEFYVILRWFVVSGKLTQLVTLGGGDFEEKQEKLIRFMGQKAVSLRESFYEDSSGEGWNRIRDSLRGIRDLTRSSGIDLAVVIFPDWDQVAEATPAPRPQRRWLDLCGELDLLCLDLYSPFIEADDRESLHLDLQHPSARGVGLAARILADFLEP